MTEDSGGGGSGGEGKRGEVEWIKPVIGDDGHAGYRLEDVRRKLGMHGKPYLTLLREGEEKREREREAEQRAKGDSKSSRNDALAGGMQQQARPRDIDRVAKGCPFIKDTLADGGAQHGEPLWKLTLDIATRCADPEETAKRLSQGHAEYDEDKTIMKLAEAQKARADNPTLGFTQCATLENNGAKPFCDTCVYQKENKSPLNTPEANEARQGAEEIDEAARDANYGRIPEAVGEDGQYQPIPGGSYEASEDNIERLNHRFRLVNEGPDTLWWENRGPNGWIQRPEEDLERGLGNVFVRLEASGSGPRRRSTNFLFPWFHQHKGRGAPLQAVFKPNQPRFPAPGEFNMWQGWGVEPNYDFYDVDASGRKTPKPQLARILDHVHKELCSGDTRDFEYAVKWHGWLFQNWEKPAHTIPIFKGEDKGTGKSLWGEWLKRMGGAHAHVFIHKEHLLGKHATYEYLCLAILDDIIVERDYKAQDVIKGLATNSTRIVEPKGRAHREIVNRVSMIVTSNHNAPLLAGVNERRQFVPKVSSEHAQDKAYFDPLRHTADNGGVEMMLGFFLTTQLKGWTPHQVHKTSELARLQLDCMKEFDKWMWDCAESEKLLGCYILTLGGGVKNSGVTSRELASEKNINEGIAEYAPLDWHFEVNAIRDAFRRHTGVRQAQMTNRAIGDALKRLGLLRKKCTSDSIGGRDPQRGYFIPGGAELRRRSRGEQDQGLC